MKIQIPILEQQIVDNTLITKESATEFEIDTSVYSEERWEKNFPDLACREGLFQYIERVHQNALTERVAVACMLKAIYCFIESDSIPTYKAFAQMINLATPDYTERLLTTLRNAFEIILNSSSVKN